ncbi:hypothetical protein ACIA6D_14205 [Streptomyces cacaoi]|uniref:hypothetical protein n=1 Tax=Streptomyces cacaoi TaxID=1898 RepID=UPI0037478DF6
MSDQDFAALLAQVIPVIVLAIIVEAHYQHDLRIKHGTGPSGWNDFDLYFQMVNLTIMAFLEVAALITARSEHPAAVIGWVAGLPGGITVGILVVVMMQIYVDTLVTAYAGKLWAPARVKRAGRIVLFLAIAAGVAGIIAVTVSDADRPSTAPCREGCVTGQEGGDAGPIVRGTRG